MAAAFSVTAIANYVKGGIQNAIELRDAEKLLLVVLDGNKATRRELMLNLKTLYIMLLPICSKAS